jgi:N-acetylglutamate synthase-like GNAT family acetyltransferase
VEIIQGNRAHIEDCLLIARNLPQYFTQDGIKNLSKDISTHQLFVACDSGEIRGFVTIIQKSPYVAEISWLAVQPEYQHKGYGSAIVNFIIIELKSMGIRLLEVKTLSPEVNYAPYEPTRRFYDKSGFLLMDIIDPYPGWEPGNPCAVYVKIL